MQGIFEHSAFRYCAVASTGFCIDASVLYSLTSLGGDPYILRFVSFTVAVSFTWWLHRKWTYRGFVAGCRRSLCLLYMAVQICGAGLSYAVFAALLSVLAITPLNSVLALTLGAFCGLVLNFTGTRFLVFGAHRGI